MTPPPASRREILAVAALTVLPLLPFLSAAFSIDAPVFVAVARQIVGLCPEGYSGGLLGW